MSKQTHIHTSLISTINCWCYFMQNLTVEQFFHSNGHTTTRVVSQSAFAPALACLGDNLNPIEVCEEEQARPKVKGSEVDSNSPGNDVDEVVRHVAVAGVSGHLGFNLD